MCSDSTVLVHHKMCLQSNTVVIFSICWQQTSFKHLWKQFYSFCKCNGTRWNCFLRSLLRKSSKHHVWKSKLCCWMTWCFSVARMMWGARREAELLSFNSHSDQRHWCKLTCCTDVSFTSPADRCVCVCGRSNSLRQFSSHISLTWLFESLVSMFPNL